MVHVFDSPGVIDPRTQKEVTMQEAVASGIINSAAGMYVNHLTGEQYPIPVAMNAGLIKVGLRSQGISFSFLFL